MYVSLAKCITQNTIRIQLEYKSSFWLKSFFLIMGYLADAIMLVVLFTRFNGIAGWRTYEIAFLYGFSTLSYTVTASVFAFCAQFSEEMIYGGYDQVLLLPVNPFIFYVLKGINLTYLSRIILSVLIIIIAFYTAALQCSFRLCLYIILSILGSILIQSAFFIAFAIPNFFIVKSDNFRSVYMGLRFFCNYPLNIYGGFIRKFFTYVIPLGFINYYPAIHIFSKSENMPLILEYLTLPVGIVLCILSIVLWHMASKHYQSTGG
ncbi:ABC transporter permease [Treponema lecithinolyticum]|nr:ABC-2 family transporter protein [Treponema lecithinolyticum]